MRQFREWLAQSYVGAVVSVAILVMLTAGPAWAQATRMVTTTGVVYVRYITGLSVAQGTLTADAQSISTTATWNSAGTTFTHWKAVITDTASAAGSLAVSIKGGASGTTNLFSVNKSGNATLGGSLNFASATALTETAAGKLSITGTTPMLQLGGTSSSFPALKQSGSQLQARLADDSALTPLVAQHFNIGVGAGQFQFSGGMLAQNTPPSSPASCGSSPAVTTANGSAVWVITGGTGGAATGCSVTMPTAANGWNCSITNITAAAAHRANVWTVQTASTTTSVTWEYQTVSTGAATIFTASDVFRGICFAY